MSLYELLLRTVERQPASPAVLGPAENDRTTYCELHDAICVAGWALARAGVRAGDCVGLHVPSGREYIILNYAVWKCGGCVVPIPVELTDAEKQRIHFEIGVDHVISGRGSTRSVVAIRCEATEVFAGYIAAPARRTREHPPAFRELDAAFIRFTSGTTGASKGVVLSHRTIAERIEAANEVLRIGSADRVIRLLSMSYHFAVSIVGYLSNGAAIVLPRNSLGRAVLDTARRHRGTLIYAAPSHYAWLADLRDAGPIPDLRLAISTTAPIEPDMARAFYSRFGVPISQALGLIEVGLPCINVDFAAERPSSVGQVLPAYQLRLLDVGLGPSVGEVAFAGKGLLDAYYEPWRARDEIMPDGWFHTGDIAEVDADGCLFLCGRSKDVINVAGMKVFPAEVEAVLRLHPSVREACVFGVEHPRFGEVSEARVVASGDPDPRLAQELLNHCAERLASYKVPTAIEFVSALRRTASGKVLRRTDRCLSAECSATTATVIR